MTKWFRIAPLLLFPGFSVGASCTVSAPAMNLGTYTGTLATAGSISVTVNCTLGLTYNVGLNAGTSAGATVTGRLLTGPGVDVNYSLYSNAARTTNWGNTAGTNTVSGVGTGSVQTITVYPEVPAGQYVTPGTYTDTITASVFSSATTATTAFSVTATVQATCIVAATSLDFGNYLGPQLDTTSSLSVTCTNTTTYYVNLNDGANPGCCFYPRMISSGVYLRYTHSQDAARSIYWGNTVNGDGESGTGTGTAQSFTVYGRIYANQNLQIGAYSDTVTVKVTY